MLSTLLIIAAISVTPDKAVALDDFREHGNRYRYLTAAALPEELREDAELVAEFWMPHLSPAVSLSGQLPVHVGGGVYRIDLQGLLWGEQAWLKLAKQYPYDDYPNPLMIRMDWLIRVTSDAEESTAYYDLLYAERGKVPANRDEFAAYWGVDLKAKGFEQAGILNAGVSGVAFESRLMEVFATSSGGDYWETFDSERAVGNQDPLEQLADRDRFSFDAGEHIAPMLKIDTTTGERSYAQAYLLTNGKRIRVDEATNTRIVRVTSHKIPVVRTPGSCVRCHTTGILDAPESAVRTLIKDGVELWDKDAEELEAKYLGLLDKRIDRNQEDFTTFVHSACQQEIEPGKVVATYSKLLRWYDEDVDLDQAARELYTDSEDLKLAIAYYSDALGPRKGVIRLNWLAHGKAVPRPIWEQIVYRQAHKALYLWQTK